MRKLTEKYSDQMKRTVEFIVKDTNPVTGSFDVGDIGKLASDDKDEAAKAREKFDNIRAKDDGKDLDDANDKPKPVEMTKKELKDPLKESATSDSIDDIRKNWFGAWTDVADTKGLIDLIDRLKAEYGIEKARVIEIFKKDGEPRASLLLRAKGDKEEARAKIKAAAEELSLFLNPTGPNEKVLKGPMSEDVLSPEEVAVISKKAKLQHDILKLAQSWRAAAAWLEQNGFRREDSNFLPFDWFGAATDKVVEWAEDVDSKLGGNGIVEDVIAITPYAAIAHLDTVKRMWPAVIEDIDLVADVKSEVHDIIAAKYPFDWSMEDMYTDDFCVDMIELIKSKYLLGK